MHACHGAGGSEGTRLLLAGQVRAQEGRQATRARGALRRGQCWIRWNVGRAAGVQAQSAQGMGAQKRGAAPPLGSGKARGVGVRRRGAARGVAAQHRGSSGQHAFVECTRAKVTRRSRVVALIVAFIKVTKVTMLHVLKAVTTLNNPATSNKKPRLLLPLVHNYPIKQHDSSAARCPASTVPGTARTQVSMSFVCGGSHAPLLDRNGRLVRESSRSRAAS